MNSLPFFSLYMWWNLRNIKMKKFIELDNNTKKYSRLKPEKGIAKDLFGRELTVGDKVIYPDGRVHLGIGRIIGFSSSGKKSYIRYGNTMKQEYIDKVRYTAAKSSRNTVLLSRGSGFEVENEEDQDLY